MREAYRRWSNPVLLGAMAGYLVSVAGWLLWHQPWLRDAGLCFTVAVLIAAAWRCFGDLGWPAE